MRRILAQLALAWLGAIPQFSYAADPAMVAAILPDEASECRYLLLLCKELQESKATLNAATARRPETKIASEEAKTIYGTARKPTKTAMGLTSYLPYF
jgi:uncharacterized heparinase superfamily protein